MIASKTAFCCVTAAVNNNSNRRLVGAVAAHSQSHCRCFGSWGKSAKAKQRRKQRMKNKNKKCTIEQALEKLAPKIYFDEGQYVTRINLNLDSTMSGQILEGYFDLPHGSGQTFKVAALTDNQELADQAAAVGATYAGGTDLVERIQNKKVKPTKHFERAVVSKDTIEKVCTGKDSYVGRLLYKHKMAPLVREHTLVAPQDFVEAVRKHANGYYFPFRTQHPGKLFTVVGKTGRDGPQEVRENLTYVLEHLFSIRPHDFGRGDRSNPKFRDKFVISMTLFASMIGGTPIGMSRLAEVPLKITEDGRIVDRDLESEEAEQIDALIPEKTDAEKQWEMKERQEEQKERARALLDDIESVEKVSCDRVEKITGRKMISMREAIDRYHNTRV